MRRRCAARGASRSTSICRRTSIPATPSARTASATCSSPAATACAQGRRPRLPTARSSTSTIPGAIPTTGSSRASRPKARRSSRRGDYFYMVTAVGGTAGPPTGHMVIAARSHSIHGPWENCPHNPLVRTTDAREKWWSRGHATLVEGPGGRLVERLSRLRERLLDARPPDAARSASNGPTTAGSASSARIFRSRFRSPRSCKASRTASRSPTISARTNSASSGRSTIPATTSARAWPTTHGALVLTGKGDSPANCSPHHLHHRRPGLSLRGRDRSRRRGHRRRALLLQQAHVLRPRLQRAPDGAPSHRHRRNAARSPTASTGGCSSASRTTGTSSRSTPRPTARPGPSSTCRWKCPAITTTSPTIS